MLIDLVTDYGPTTLDANAIIMVTENGRRIPFVHLMGWTAPVCVHNTTKEELVSIWQQALAASSTKE